MAAEPRGGVRWAGTTVALGWLVWTGMLQWSVVRFRVAIVVVLTGVALALVLWLLGRWSPRPGRPAAALALVGSVAAAWWVPLFSHLDDGHLLLARLVVSAVGVLGAVLVLRGRSGPLLAVSALGQLALGVLVIRGAPAPTIDVWVTLQQASDALLHGENVYTTPLTDTYGVSDFTYLPWSSVLLAPGRLLLGDVRWALLFWSLVLLVALVPLGAGRVVAAGAGRGGHSARVTRLPGVPLAAATAAALLVVLPGSITQVDQSWTEPLLAAGLVLWAALVRHGRLVAAVVVLGVLLATKQHIAVLLPLVAVWRGFGWRRAAASAGIGLLLVLPWLLADPAAFLHDTVTYLMTFPPIRFANTWVLFAQHVLQWTWPSWLTGCLVLGTLTFAAVQVRRTDPAVGTLLRWFSLVLLVANLANKQAFYNQYWLCAVLALVSLVPPAATGPSPTRATERSPAGLRASGAPAREH